MKPVKSLVVIISVLAVISAGVYVMVPRLNAYKSDGELVLQGLSAPVKVVRDEKGMAYLHAATTEDALHAQGFIAAQDRLFQMEAMRRLAQGRLSEMIGEKGLELDVRMRTIGLHRIAKRHEKILNEKARRFVQVYIDGVNRYIATMSDEHHLEFRLAGIKPEPWTIVDSLSVLYYMGWDTSANLKNELVMQMLIEKLGPEKARGLYPLSSNPDDPRTAVNIGISGRDGENKLEGFASDSGIRWLFKGKKDALEVGSNNWAANRALSAGKGPIVANDPHLDTRILPGAWYPCGIIVPGLRAVGVTVPGFPGIIIGRNEHCAVSVTNSYNDCQDLYIETVDPNNKDYYLEGARSVPFEVVIETMRVKDKKAAGGFREVKHRVLLTRRGPVVSGVLQGMKTQKVVSLRWAPAESMGPSLGAEDMLKARSADDMRKAIAGITAVMLNFVFADDRGNIGWQTSGRLPIRIRGDGTTPFVVNDGADNWNGWIPFEKMPSSSNPPRGWLGTCNHRTVGAGYPWYISSYFSPHYRYSRLKQLFDSKAAFTADDHWAFQRDAKNLMAERISPVMVRALLAEKDTAELGKILEKWDYIDDPESAAPLVFQSVYTKFAFMTYRDELGDDLATKMIDVWYYWQERLEAMVMAGASPWFDDRGTPAKETMDDIFVRAARDVMKERGGNPVSWRWGDVHRLELVSPIMRSGPLRGLFGGGSHVMGGSGETLYRARYKFSDPYSIDACASLRMVVDLSDGGKVLAVLPAGVCGRLFNRHTTDQTAPFMSGEKRYWWYSDELIRAHAAHTCMLVPGGPGKKQ